MREREYQINIRLNLKEERMLEKKSKKVGLTKSELIRSLISEFEPKEKPTEQFYEDLNSIRKVGNVLNQITARMHYLGYVEDEKFLRKTIDNLNEFILDIKRKYLLQEKK